MHRLRVELSLDDLIVVDGVDISSAVHKKARAFLAGEKPLRLPLGFNWKTLGLLCAVAIAVAVFLHRAIFAWNSGWADNLPVFMAFPISMIVALGFLAASAQTFYERNEPRLPTHVVPAVVTKTRLTARTGVWTLTGEYLSPTTNDRQRVQGQSTGGPRRVGESVVVLFYSNRKTLLL